MSDLAHLFGLACLIIVGRAMPGLIVEMIRRGGDAAGRSRAALGHLRQRPALQSTLDLPLEQTP